jgi:putative acetyltransferase
MIYRLEGMMRPVRSVRRAEQGDLEALAAVAHRSITITAASAYNDQQIQAWAALLTGATLNYAIANTAMFVVENDLTTSGFANLAITPNGRAEVDFLFVDPDFIGQGVARLAVEAVEEEARGQKIERLWADASLLAAPVFEHFGFVVEERYEKHVGSVVYPNTWLRKTLL